MVLFAFAPQHDGSAAGGSPEALGWVIPRCRQRSRCATVNGSRGAGRSSLAVSAPDACPLAAVRAEQPCPAMFAGNTAEVTAPS